MIFILKLAIQSNHKCVETYRKGPYVEKIKIEFCIVCSRGHSTGHFDPKIRCPAQFLMVLLQILLFKTCIIKKLNLLSILISKFYIPTFKLKLKVKIKVT